MIIHNVNSKTKLIDHSQHRTILIKGHPLQDVPASLDRDDST